MNKKFKKIVSVFLVCIMLASCFIGSGALSVSADNKSFTDIVLTVGSDPSERNITWFIKTDKAGEVQYALKKDLKNGEFPSSYQTATATTISSRKTGYYSNQATMKGLKANTEYVYRFKNENLVSDLYYFSTGGTGDFSFIFAGDPQIDSSAHGDSWRDTLEKSISKFDPEFVLSGGDQVNVCSNENQYSYFLNDLLRSLPLATSLGNHDIGSANSYRAHFNLPNESEIYGVTPMTTADYWFVYNNVLFMCLNTNSLSTAQHKTFMENAIKANPSAQWRVVVFHHSLYSAGKHSLEGTIINRRNTLSPIFDELDIDVALMGHDHVYTRTYMMNGTEPDTKTNSAEIRNHSGVLYITANSASGSKYYDIASASADYIAKADQSQRKNITLVEVTNNSFGITTYYADDMSVLDKVTLYKTENRNVIDKTKLQSAITKAEALNSKDYTEKSWTAFQKTLSAATALNSDTVSTQSEIDAATKALNDAVNSLVKSNTAAPSSKPDQGSSNPANSSSNVANSSSIPASNSAVDTSSAISSEALSNSAADTSSEASSTDSDDSSSQDSSTLSSDASSASTDGNSTGSPAGPTIYIIIGIAALLLLAGATLIIVFTLKKKKKDVNKTEE